jgi:DNA processing protein
MTDQKLFWLGFSHIPAVGPQRFSQLESHFPSIEEAWHASAVELKNAGLEDGAVKAIVETRPKIDLTAEEARMNKAGVRLLTWHDNDYPARLKEIYNRPAWLYIKGEIKEEDEWCVAVVGTRRPSIYGRQVADEIAGELARNRITVVSGLAKGIDTISHQSALNAGGRTVAVLGGGLESIYPAENTKLARQITDHGALISEYPPGTMPRPEYFPRRNRIISGLSLGTLVVEAGEISGALITAQLALEQNREVFAVPGSILSIASLGTNKLIQEGAKLVTGVSDILEELNLRSLAQKVETRGTVPATFEELNILKFLGREPQHIDDICENSRLPARVVSSSLATMELKGIVKQVGAMSYAVVGENQACYTVSID